MKISKIEKLIIFYSAVIMALLYYIDKQDVKASVLFFIIFISLEIILYFIAFKFWSKIKSKKSSSTP
jgi:hypothetical protein